MSLPIDMLYNAYFRGKNSNNTKAIVDIYNIRNNAIETTVHIPFNRIFVLDRDSIMLNIDYNILHHRLVIVDILNINNITNLRVTKIQEVF